MDQNNKAHKGVNIRTQRVPRKAHEQARYDLWRRTRANMEGHNLRFTPNGTKIEPAVSNFDRALGVFEVLMRLSGFHKFGTANALDIRLRHYELRCAELPKAFQGYKLLHLSDLHLDMIDGLDEAIAAAAHKSSADVCVLTGDYRADTRGGHSQIVKSLEKILDRTDCPDGVFGTLGNHDDHTMAESLEDLGIRVLANEAITLQKGEERLQVLGLDDAHAYFTPAAEFALHNADNFFSIVLAHSPDMAIAAANAGHHVYLCGHTHGGQICLPGGIPIITHCEAERKLARGRWELNGMQGLTNVGCGVSGLPLRYFSRGEVALITLRSVEDI